MPATRLKRPPVGPPDASMSLINELLQRPLDPGYAAAAGRRAASAGPVPMWGRSPLVAVAAVVVGLTFAVSATTLRIPPGAAAQERAVLLERIEARRGAVEQREVQVESLQAQILQLQTAGGGRPDVASAQVKAAAAATALHGPGLVITLDDAPSNSGADADGDPRTAADAPGRIVARDLQAVTNALWAAGAEGIAINGHRLTATSSIRFAGAAILVAYRPLTRPYTVSAIAGPSSIDAFSRGDGGAYLEELRRAYQARAELTTAPEVRLPAGSVLDLRAARREPTGAPAPSGAAASSTSSGATS